MIVISGSPGSEETQRKVGQAALETADLILVREAVPLACKGALEGFCGTAFALDESLEAKGIRPEELEKGVRVMARDELRELLRRSGGNPDEIP
ncbi:MAG: hypothetical protein KAR83_02800 [Thermodesulfovibrionales bacterium]|nr:hypothetical protein [Thermodesulfovibrionales bacterium]